MTIMKYSNCNIIFKIYYNIIFQCVTFILGEWVKPKLKIQTELDQIVQSPDLEVEEVGMFDLLDLLLKNVLG